MPSESVTDDKSIISGTSSIAAKPAVSELLSSPNLSATFEFDFVVSETLIFDLEDRFFCLPTYVFS